MSDRLKVQRFSLSSVFIYITLKIERESNNTTVLDTLSLWLILVLSANDQPQAGKNIGF